MSLISKMTYQIATVVVLYIGFFVIFEFSTITAAELATADFARRYNAPSIYLQAMKSVSSLQTNRLTFESNATLLNILDLLTDPKQQWREAVSTIFLETKFTVTNRCQRHLRRLVKALVGLEKWTQPFLDSMGKPQPGLLQGATTWLGSFDQCLEAATVHDTNTTDGFSGSYCLLELQSVATQPVLKLTRIITFGSCWPDSCSMGDAVNVTSILLSIIPNLAKRFRIAPAANECRSKLKTDVDKLTTGALAMLAILASICLCLAAGTLIDLLERSRSRSAAAAAAAAAATASAATVSGTPVAESSSAASSSAAADENFDCSGTAGDDAALLAAAEINRDNRDFGRFRCLGIIRAILLCFSVRANAVKLLDQGQAGGSLGCINGIRFISMSWVILGHTYIIGLISASNLGQLVPKWLNDWTFQAILNATVAVDTFFVLSGLLATYLFLREVDRRRGQLKRINWLRFYMHRYCRLTVPYMIILGVYTTLIQYAYDGPRYQRHGLDANCFNSWWQNLLYINNMFDLADMCMPWSWYLANDMQFYIISPIFLTVMAKRPKIGAGLVILGILATSVGLGLYSTIAGIGPAGSGSSSATFSEIYTRPWFRIGPYLVGSLTGLLAHKLLSPSIDDFGFPIRRRHAAVRWRLRWSLRLLGWGAAAALCLSVLYGLYDVQNGRVTLSQPVTSLYNATFRLAWSLGVAWVILACATGNGGCIAEFLSARVFAPLSRLSYCAYLIHPVIMTAVEIARRDTYQWNAWTPVGAYLMYLMAAYAAAFGASLALESPFIALERLAME